MQPSDDKLSPWQMGFASLAGLFFFVVIVKFGNPVILENQLMVPSNFYEMLFQAWPVKWGYYMLCPVALVGLFTIQWKRVRWHWILALPLIWLAWQFISATRTVDAELTSLTVKHFCACVVCFYLGYFALGQCRNPWPLWVGFAVAFCWIVHVGFDQHFGGLAATRRMFYQMPNWRDAPPDLLKRIASDRIFSTFVYANAFAGALLLLLPVTLAFVWRFFNRHPLMQWGLAGALGLSGLACMFWSGSKAGWLLTLVLGMVILGRSPVSVRCKRCLVYGVLVAGVVGFGIKYATFFERGSTSVVARFDYWRAALQTFEEHSMVGTGPGTFSIPYRQIKNPKAEMARLCHNDYLEQATDSGLIGFFVYFAFISVSFSKLYRYSTENLTKSNDILLFAIFLGIAAVFLHSMVEFHLYIPALAWPSFLLLGWLWRRKLAKSVNV